MYDILSTNLGKSEATSAEMHFHIWLFWWGIFYSARLQNPYDKGRNRACWNNRFLAAGGGGGGGLNEHDWIAWWCAKS